VADWKTERVTRVDGRRPNVTRSPRPDRRARTFETSEVVRHLARAGVPVVPVVPGVPVVLGVVGVVGVPVVPVVPAALGGGGGVVLSGQAIRGATAPLDWAQASPEPTEAASATAAAAAAAPPASGNPLMTPTVVGAPSRNGVNDR